MIVSKTPLRVSFAGGGSDTPSWYLSGDMGAVVSATINRYIYITASDHWEQDRLRVSYSMTENVQNLDQLRHGLVRESLKKAGIHSGMEITSIANIPGRGSGLGSSSSYTVGVLNALAAFRGIRAEARWLASAACEIELVWLKGSGGKQDQYAAAYGGVNLMRFDPSARVEVEKIEINAETRKALEDRFVLYYTGLQRNSENLLRHQARHTKNAPKARAEIKAMVGLACQAREALCDGRIEELASIVDEGWQRKRIITKHVSLPEIDALYDRAVAAGSLGCKLCGAGGGGFLLVYIPEGKQEVIDHALKLRRINVSFGVPGSEIVFNDQ